MRDRLLIKLAALHAKHPWGMFFAVLCLTIVFGFFASRLSITMQMKDLLPAGDPKVDNFNEIIDEFSTATSLIIVAQGEEYAIKAFADDIAPRITQLVDTGMNVQNRQEIQELEHRIALLRAKKPESSGIENMESRIEELKRRIDFRLFQRVDYKGETEFLRNHGLLLVKSSDLQSSKEVFYNPNLIEFIGNLNTSLEKTYVEQEESISTREKEDGAVGFLDGVEALCLQMDQAVQGGKITRAGVEGAVDEYLLGEPYFLSYDKTCLLLNAIPNFTIMDRDLLQTAAEKTQVLVDSLLTMHPGVTAGLSGDIARERDEQVYSSKSLGYTTIIAFTAILLLLVLSFNMVSAPILALVTLAVGIVWANGFAYIIVGKLNMMTAMLSVVLLGLGIDFAIHIISGLTEWRAAGDSIEEALKKTFLKNGKGIITGALTTACAFLALVVSRSRGMKEMGIVTGSGLLAIMLATFLLLPALLVFRERHVEKKQIRKSGLARPVSKDIRFKFMGRCAAFLARHYVISIAASIIVSALLIWSALHIQYEQNYLKMEPKGLTSIALTDTITHKFDLSMEYALCLASSTDESRELADAFRDLSTVAMTNDISVYIPSTEQQEKRAGIIRQIEAEMRQNKIRTSVSTVHVDTFLAQFERLEMNIIELQDMAYVGGQDKVDSRCTQLLGNPEDEARTGIFQRIMRAVENDPANAAAGLSRFQRFFAPHFRETVLSMCSTDPLSLEDLPESVLGRYMNPAGTRFMITIYPSGQLFSNAEALNRFVEDAEGVSIKATGTPLVSVAWLKIAAQDGKIAIMLTLVIVFLLLWLDFGAPRYALIAMLPLALGAFWMVGIMNLAGILLSFMTMMGLPLIIGIGIDDGVHIMHRWQHEGTGHITTVFASTGKAVLITSLTTMIAFGSMTFSIFPAWAWFGESLFIGVGACFLTTVLILPGIIGFLERKPIDR